MSERSGQQNVYSVAELSGPRSPRAMGGCFWVETASRLHFGLWMLDQASARRFGGVGVMVTPPSLRLRVEAAEAFDVAGHHRQRLWQAAHHWASYYRCPLPACRLTLVSSPPLHVGLGVGTQIALATAVALHVQRGEPIPSAEHLAQSTGRGRRSAVGVYGFLRGGLIVESGKAHGERLSPLEAHVQLPPNWRFVLVRPLHAHGLSGEQEEAALAQLSCVPTPYGEQLANEARRWLVPAARAGDFPAFSRSLRRYGELAGDCFRAIQGGRYCGAQLQRVVEWLHKRGIDGVGQSSWGPTLFAVIEDPEAAATLQDSLHREFASGYHVTIARSTECGARLLPHPPSSDPTDAPFGPSTASIEPHPVSHTHLPTPCKPVR